MKQTITFLILLSVMGTGAMAQSKKAQIANLQHIVDSLSERVEMLNGQVLQRNEENSKLTKELSDAKQREDNFRQSLKQVEENKEKICREDDARISELNKEIAELKKTNVELKKKKSELREKYYIKQGFVSLGLPSGTLWKKENEKGDHYTYDGALEKYGKNMPTQRQFVELEKYCSWEWVGDKYDGGYKVTGPNGNSIFLPAAGYRNCRGAMEYVGSYGFYWSSISSDNNRAWYLIFDWGSKDVSNINARCYGYTLRLVQN